MNERPLVITGGAVVTPSGVIDPGDVVVERDGRIAAVAASAPTGGPADADVIDAAGCWVTPGFIDVQINGGHGIDLTTEPERADELGRHLPQYGVTAFVPTIITCREEQRAAALKWWDGRARSIDASAAAPLGLHLEGPMLAAARRGAHPVDLLLEPSPGLIDGWSRDAGVVLLTLAPELPGALELISSLTERGVVVALGHTDCTAEQFAAGIGAGARYVTHLFNGMRPFGHRDPGPIGATLADEAVIAGLICDGIHVDPIAVRMAWRSLGPERLNLVTDAVAVLGAAPATARLGSVDVTVDGGGVRTAGGVLAGSNLSLDQAVRNLIAFTGCSVPDAVRTVTATPAQLLGLTERGALSPGRRGDVTVLGAELDVVATVVGGDLAWRS